MEQSKSELIYEKRELDKLGLETYVMNMQNALDYPIDKLITELGKKLKQNRKEYKEWINLEDENPEKYLKLKEKASNHKHSLDLQLQNCIIEIIETEDEIAALLEVKIIYAFKHFEINLKKLIRAAYEDANFAKNYKWENIKQYLLLKNIDIKKISSYSEVNQLRELNNAIKHSEKYLENEHLKRLIPELNVETPSNRQILKFYNRIKDSPRNFIDSLSSNIYENLYYFDDEKIEKTAESLALRMDKGNIKKLISKLNGYT